MVQSPKVIKVQPGSELDRLLAEAGEQGLILVRDRSRFRLALIEGTGPEPSKGDVELADESDIWSGYDPEQARAGMREAAGSWSDLDAEALKNYIHEAREAGSRPWNMP